VRVRAGGQLPGSYQGALEQARPCVQGSSQAALQPGRARHAQQWDPSVARRFSSRSATAAALPAPLQTYATSGSVSVPQVQFLFAKAA